MFVNVLNSTNPGDCHAQALGSTFEPFREPQEDERERHRREAGEQGDATDPVDERDREREADHEEHVEDRGPATRKPAPPSRSSVAHARAVTAVVESGRFREGGDPVNAASRPRRSQASRFCREGTGGGVQMD